MVLRSSYNHVRHKYAKGPQATNLHTVDVWLPGSAANYHNDGKWVIYIHGGAWRDPDIDSMTFEPAIEVLSARHLHTSILGFASINYRLSPYPSHPNPSSPDDLTRNAKYPDHLLDISKALVFLDEEYGISRGYILVGHSAGATLAFQIQEQYADFKVPQPLGLIGVAGIYDLVELVKTHETIPVYRQFVVNAFGPDEIVWKNASPSSSTQPAAWQKAKAIVIAHSNEDELLDRWQSELMFERVRKAPSCEDIVHFLSARGFHDEIWKDGHELARLVEEALVLL